MMKVAISPLFRFPILSFSTELRMLTSFIAPTEYVQKDADKFWKPEISGLVKEATDYLLASGVSFEKEAVGPALEDYIRSREWPMGKVMNCLRLALTGAASGLGIADILSFIGKEEFRRRIDAAAERLG